MNILVADDHPLFRKGLLALLTESLSCQNVYEAGDVAGVLDIIKTKKLDIVLLGLGAQWLDGFYLLRDIRDRHIKKFRIVVVTLYNDPIVLHWLQDCGVEGYVSKAGRSDDVIDAIHAVSKGYYYYPDEFQRDSSNFHVRRRSFPVLSASELGMLALIANGYTSKQIADRLGYTLRTIETKRLRLEKKLCVKNSSELISLAYRTGLLKICGGVMEIRELLGVREGL